MESFTELYREQSLLRVKYEHLCNVCKTLLRPWPNYDASGRKIAREANTVGATASDSAVKQNCSQRKDEINEREDPTEHIDVPQERPENVTELHLLDEILNRAQQIRGSQQDDSTQKKPSSARRNKMAARVYGNPVAKKTVKVSSQRHRMPGKQPGARSTTKMMSRGKQPTMMAERSGDQSSSYLVQLQSSSSKTASSLDERGTKPIWVSATDGIESAAAPAKRRDQPAVLESSSHQEQVEEGFHIKHNGSRLAMPSKYHKLLKLLSQISDHVQLPSSHNLNLTADHFCDRLTPKEAAISAELIHLQLASEAYSVLREYLLSQEWTVSDRSQWQEVFKMKSKLDLILDHIRELSAGREPQRPTALPPEPQRPTALPPEPQPPSALPPEPQPLSASPPDPFVYSSLDYWRSLAECVSQLKRGVWDLEVAKFCSEVLLPKVSRLQVTDRSFSAIIQLSHELAGLETKPIFLTMEKE